MITCTVDWNNGDGTVDGMLRCVGLEKNGRVQKAIDNAVLRYMEPYTPFDTGTLAASPYSATEIGSGLIKYPGPYPHYLYYGEVYGPNIPIFEDNSGEPTTFRSPRGRKKTPTGRQLQYNTSTNALAGSFWFARAMAAHQRDVLHEARAASKEGK